MHKFAGFILICLLIVGLIACDNSKLISDFSDNSTSHGHQASLLNGKISFTLPAGLSDQSEKVIRRENDVYIYADTSRKKAVIVILSDNTTEKLDVLIKRLVYQQRIRDADLQVITNKTIKLSGKPLQRLDSIITIGDEKTYSSVVIGKVDNHLMTLQIALPADQQHQAQTEAETMINTLKFQ